MQMLDQQIAPARALAEQRAHFVERLRIDLPALGRAAADGRLPAVAVGSGAAADSGCSSCHPSTIEPFRSQTIPCRSWLDR